MITREPIFRSPTMIPHDLLERRPRDACCRHHWCARPRWGRFGITGVAPEATLYMYRVLGCNGGVTDDVLMQGFQQAVEDGVDLISMSIGGAFVWTSGSPWIPSSMPFKIEASGFSLRLATTDSLVSTSRHRLLSYPVLSRSARSATPSSATAYNAVDSAGTTIEYVRIVPYESDVTYNVFVTSSSDGITCDQQPWWDAAAAYPDPSKVIVLIGDGSECKNELISGWHKLASLIFGRLSLDNADFSLYPPGYIQGYEVVQLRQSQADKLTAGAASKGTRYTLKFSGQSVHDADQPTARTVSYYSTYGPTMEMASKPQLSAPGRYHPQHMADDRWLGLRCNLRYLHGDSSRGRLLCLAQAKVPKHDPQEIAGRLQSTADAIDAVRRVEYPDYHKSTGIRLDQRAQGSHIRYQNLANRV